MYKPNVMKMKTRNVQRGFFALIAMMLMSGSTLFAQFSLSGEFRPRAEYRHGFKTLFSDADTAAGQVSQRTRLNAQYKVDNLRFGLSFQDVRFWGETPQLVAASNRMMIHQAWAEYGINDHLSVKLGRMELVYDDARIFGNVDWAQQARAHDLALIKYEKNYKLHLGLAFNQRDDLLKGSVYGLGSNYKSMQFLWYNRSLGKLGMSVLFLNNGMEKRYTEQVNGVPVPKYKTVYSQTAGAHLNYKAKKLNAYGNFYYTGGKDVTERELNAMNAMAGFDYSLSKGFGVGAGYELLSGTSQKEKLDNPTTFVNKSFNPFYGTNHKFNGFMDYFYVGNHINNVGLNNLFVNLTYKKGKGSYVITTHFFSAAADVITPGLPAKIMDKGLGTELDFSFSYRLNDITALSGGYSQLFATETMEALKGGSHKTTNNWAWLMIAFRPVFIK